jgi:[ribosomal protein S18]-alanine N-acetyltransferase
MTAPGILRRMTEDDLSRVMEIETRVCAFPWTIGIFRDCLNVGYLCWVYTEHNVIQGYAILSFGAGEAHVLTISVDADCQSRGIGRTLMGFLMDGARRLGADTIYLEVRVSNQRAIDLYSRLGFVEVGIRRGYYEAKQGREDAMVMAHTLISPFADVDA